MSVAFNVIERFAAAFEANVAAPIREATAGGISEHMLALSFSTGFVGGIFPFPGLTFLACFALTALLGGNHLIAQVVLLPPLLHGRRCFAWLQAYDTVLPALGV